MRLVFCGTPEFAVPSLAAVVEAGHEVALVLTQPDRPSGRGLQLVASPVKQWALLHNLQVEQPEKIRKNELLRARLEAIAPDAILVVAYGRIIPLWMLQLPPLGNINLHGSLLPRYRGAAPIQWAIANGEQVTGVTTMLLEEGLDTGPTLEQAELAVPPNATAADLFPQLATLGAPLILSTLAGLAARTLAPVPQDHAQATQAPILTREDGHIHFIQPAAEIYNRWRGFQPWPGAWTTLGGKKFTIVLMAIPKQQNSTAVINMAAQSTLTSQTAVSEIKEAPGTLVVCDGKLFAICGHHSAIELLEVQLEGKRAIPAADFLRGHPHLAGAHLG